MKLDEQIYQKSALACELNLIGRLSLPKGSSPITASDLHGKLSTRWKLQNPFILTPIGKGFFCLRFKHKNDQNLALLNGHLNLSPAGPPTLNIVNQKHGQSHPQNDLPIAQPTDNLVSNQFIPKSSKPNQSGGSEPTDSDLQLFPAKQHSPSEETKDTFGSSEDDSEYFIYHNATLQQEAQSSPGRVQETFTASNLSFSEALDWGNMAEDEPLPSWEACADAAFEAATIRNRAQTCYLLKDDSSSSILNQDFTPLQGNIAISSQSPPSTNSRPISHTSHSPIANTPSPTDPYPSSGSNYTPTPQPKHQKTKNVLPIHKQKKMSKAAKREANAFSRNSKHNSNSLSHDPDEYQWQVLLADQKKRETEAAANASLHISSTSLSQGQEIPFPTANVQLSISFAEQFAALF
ncbi:hypothetical protein LguiA_025511 [Lonicera macranthoides]